MLIIFAFIIFTVLRSMTRRKLDRGVLKSVQVLGDRVIFPEQVKLTRGLISVFALKGSNFNVILRTNYIKIGHVEEHNWISLNDICWSPPIIKAVYGSQVHAELPAYIVTSGVYRGLVVTCIDTESARTRAEIEALSEHGYFRGSYRANKGIIKTRLEWTSPPRSPITPAKKLGKAAIEICVKGIYVKGCSELLELTDPGINEKEYKYPLVRKILVGDTAGEGLEEIAGLADMSIGLLAVYKSYLRLLYKHGLRRRTIREVMIA